MAVNNTALVKVMADNTQLTKELADTTRRLKGFERQAERMRRKNSGVFAGMTNSLKNMAGPLAGAGVGLAAFGVAANVLKGAVDQTRALANETRVLQRETGMSAEQASAFVSIGKRMGVSAKQLSTGFGMLSKQIVKARTGTATSTAAFNALGVSMGVVNSGDTHKVLLGVAEGFKALEDGPQKTALAMQLFGRSGKNLIPILNQGRDGIGELEARMKFLGKTVDQDTIDKSVALGKAQKDLNDAFEGLKIKLGAAVIPKITEFAQGLSDAITSLSSGKKPTTELGDKFKRFALEAKKVYEQVKRAIGQVVAFGQKNPTLVKIVGTLVAMRLAAKLISFALPIKSTMRFLGVLGKLGKTKAGQAAVSKISSAFGGLWSRLRGTVAAAGSKVAASLAGAGRRAGASMGSKVSAGFDSKKAGLVSKSASIGTSMGKAMGVAARAGFLVGVVALLQGFNSLIDRLRKKNKIVNVTGWVAQNFPMPGFGNQSLNQITKRAMGGVVTRPELSLIGEAGPEAVVPLSRPKRARQVMRDAGLMGTGGNNYFTINTTGSVDEQALAAKIGWQLASRGIA